MKVIYIAGPYRANTVHGILENIRRAEAEAIEVWRMGHVAFCPHMNSAFFDGLVPDENFLNGTLEILSRSDGMLLIEDTWQNSEGTKAEIAFCKDNNIPVFYSKRQLILHTWSGTTVWSDCCGEDFKYVYTGNVCPKCAKPCSALPF